jgi:hypothetical protein
MCLEILGLFYVPGDPRSFLCAWRSKVFQARGLFYVPGWRSKVFSMCLEIQGLFYVPGDPRSFLFLCAWRSKAFSMCLEVLGLFLYIHTHLLVIIFGKKNKNWKGYQKYM